ncbi:MAG: undecaprenyl-phosphate galactose phosphotransferase WbaP [Lentisphaeria bacterium]|nr:undecaprenyl-phosphate galactose phosphotransferase WbaP [Lentisphaeria bacterium]
MTSEAGSRIDGIPPGRCRPRLTALLLAAGDLIVLTLCNAAAVYGYLAIRGRYEPSLYGRLWPCLLLFILAYDVVGLYHGVALYPGAGLGPAEELRRGTIATSTCYVLLTSVTFLAKTSTHYSRAVFLIAWMLSVVALPSLRGVLRHFFARRSWWGASCLVHGCGATAQRMLRILRRHPDYGLKPVALLAPDAPTNRTHIEGIPILRRQDDVPFLARQGIHYVIAAPCDITTETLLAFIEGPGRHFRHILVVPPDFGHSGIWASARCIETVLGLEIRQNLLLPFPRACKRCIDLAVVLAATPVLLPLTLAIAILVRLTSPGPAFYSQARLGRDGRPFRMWKFRTMDTAAEQILRHHLEANPEAREEWERTRKLRHDPRVTPLGASLRRLSLDELPQFWNVLLGNMSLVGPRPIVQAETPLYGEMMGLYTRVRPGLTGLWQVSGRNAIPFDERVALDAFYVRNWSVWLDLYVLLKTFPAVASGDGAF